MTDDELNVSKIGSDQPEMRKTAPLLAEFWEKPANLAAAKDSSPLTLPAFLECGGPAPLFFAS
jgi:hypothetical protein